MQHGIPAVMFITWPDMWYHSSEDTPDKQDPTQYKRAAAVGLGGLAVISVGTDEMAARIVSDNLGRGLARMGESHTKGLGYMADATATSLPDAYKEAKNAIRHQAEIEKAVVRSASVMWTNVAEGKKKTAVFEPLIDQRAASLLNEVKAAYQLEALQRNVPATEPAMTAEERAASNLIIEQVAQAGRGGGGGGGGGGARGGRGAGPAGPSLPEEDNAEFAILLGKGLSVMQVRDFLSGEFTPLPLADVMAVLKARETAGSIKLAPKAGSKP
jgi:hypothetical protein